MGWANYTNGKPHTYERCEQASFRIDHGVKQRDPRSTWCYLLLAAMESCMRNLTTCWNRRSPLWRGQWYGLHCTNSGGRLSNLGSADDVVLFVSANQDVVRMLRDLEREAPEFELEIHFGKTVVFTNSFDAAKAKCMKVNADIVRVTGHGDSAKHFGRKLWLVNFYSLEIDRCIAAGWAVCAKFRLEFHGCHVKLNVKIQLFQATVTLAVLYGRATQNMNKEFEAKRQPSRRRMLCLLFLWRGQRHMDEHGAAEL